MSDPKLPRIADTAIQPPRAEERGSAAEAPIGAPQSEERGRVAGAPGGASQAEPAGVGADPVQPSAPSPTAGAEVRMPRSPLFTPRVWDAPESAAAGDANRSGPGSAPHATAARSAPAPAQQPGGAEPSPGVETRHPSQRQQPASAPPEATSLEERLRPRGPLAPLGMSDRGRFIIATLIGMVLAVGVHIAIVLALPHFAENDAFSRLRSTIEAGNAVPIAPPGRADTWVPLPDPAAAVAACAYDLRDGPVRISAKTGTLVQSLSFHARGGGVYFAVTDRAAVRGELDLVVMTRRQLDEALAAEDEAEPTRDVRIVAPRPEGFVIVRALAPSPSLRPQAEEAARSVACTIEGDEEAVQPPPAPPVQTAPPPAPQPSRPAAPPSTPNRR